MAAVIEVRVEKYNEGGVVRGRSGIRFRGSLDSYVALEDYGPNDPRVEPYPKVRDNAIGTYRRIVDVSEVQPGVKAIPLVQRDRTLIEKLQAIGKTASAK